LQVTEIVPSGAKLSLSTDWDGSSAWSNRSTFVKQSGGVPMGQFDLKDLLEIVEEFGLAGRGLIAWEFTLDEEAIEPTWRLAFDQRLLRRVGRDLTGEPMYTLTLKGRTRLHQLRQRSIDP
jgi:hypothetical protein